MGRATLPAGLSRRVGQTVGPHPVGTHRWAAKGGLVHVKTHLSGPSGNEVGQSLRTALQAQQVKTPLSNWPTRRAGWLQLSTTPLSNWPTRRAGWTYPYQFPSATRPSIPLSHRPLRRAGQHRLPHFGELDAALSALQNTPNIGRIFGSLNKRPVSALTRPPS